MNTKTNISVILMLFFCAISFAQVKTISGTITEASGIPLPGVNILIKDTNTGALSDFEGNYSIEAEEGQILVFSYIGFQSTEITLGTGTSINVQMEEDETSLDEVVVTALGISRSKKSLGYAVQDIKAEEVNTAKDVNFVNSLSGKLAGVNISRNNNFGGSTNVIIRGYTSLTGNNQPLFVIDGTPISNQLNNSGNSVEGRGGYDYGNAASDINPDDIESINVLKGAAASALYGSRAANGVIIITTKKGITKDGIGVTINSNVTFSKFDPDTFARYQKEYGGGTNQTFREGTIDADGDGTNDIVVYTNRDASFGPRFNPNLSVFQWDAFLPDNKNYRKATPWVAAKNDPTAIFQTGVLLSNSISLDGSSDKGNFRLGFTDVNQTGILPNSKIQRRTFTFSGSHKLTDKLTASTKITYTNNESRGRFATGYDENSILPGLRQWYQTNVDIEGQREAYFNSRENASWNLRTSQLTSDNPYTNRPQYWDNPFWTLYENYQTDGRDRVFGNIVLNYQVNNWFNLTARVTMDRFDELREERVNTGSFNQDEYNRYNAAFREMNYDLISNFNYDFSEKLNFTGLLGINLVRQNFSSIFSETNGGLKIPRYYALENSKDPLGLPTERENASGINGYYASASFGYDNLLYLDTTLRRDQSSTLPKNDNVYWYPSISTSFVFSNVLETPWLDFGKLRLNYAEVGKSPDPLRLQEYFSFGNNFNDQATISRPNRRNNTEIKRELTKSYEVGLEALFLKKRLGFDVSAYQTNSEDQITPLEVSYSTGYSTKVVNAGEIENKGVELSLTGSPIKTKNFEWSVNINWSTYTSEVVSLPPGATNLNISGGTLQNGITVNAAAGEPYGTIRGTAFRKLNGQNVIDPIRGRYEFQLTEDGAIDENVIIGNIIPDWNGGINNTVKYKNLSLSFLIDIQKGGDVYSLDHAYGASTGIFDNSVGLNDLGNPIRDPLTNDSTSGGIILDGVLANGTKNNVRTVYGGGGNRITDSNGIRYNDNNPYTAWVAPDEYHVYDASYVKLREVILSYSLPKVLLTRLPITGATISAIGRNLWIIDKNIPYSDPEAGLSAGNLQGFQSSAYPTAKEYGINLKVNF
ncbi:SusC/RagA family TonB-linked outer membrane protein [Aquimarina sp. 2201CG1-2-11]|uniref:SusC/RagA family TonB-linked outer membrane protein n=1 Tax=Aquimarina discodermiae TaxID=3231043 RepID=UPI003461B8A7